MAHVGAVRQVVGAQRPREQLVHVRRLVGRAAGGVEDAAVRRAGPDVFADELEGVRPGDRRIVRLPFPDHHRFTQPALVAQPVLGLVRQLRDGVPRPELRAHCPQGVLLGHGLGAVFAELGSLALFVRLRPRTARAVEAASLVQAQQRLGRARDTGLRHGPLQGHHHGLDAGSFRFRFPDGEGVLVDVRNGGGLFAELHCSNFLTGQRRCLLNAVLFERPVRRASFRGAPYRVLLDTGNPALLGDLGQRLPLGTDGGVVAVAGADHRFGRKRQQAFADRGRGWWGSRCRTCRWRPVRR